MNCRGAAGGELPADETEAEAGRSSLCATRIGHRASEVCLPLVRRPPPSYFSFIITASCGSIPFHGICVDLHCCDNDGDGDDAVVRIVRGC